MKINDGFVIRKMGEQYVVVPLGKASKKFNGMVKLNSTGAFLWEQMKEDITETELIEALMENYEVDVDTAKQDVENFINSLQGPGIIG